MMMAMRFITTRGFEDAARASEFGPAPQLQWIKIADLVVDDTYQRPLDSRTSHANVKAIAGRFDWRFFAPVVVSPIAGGLYAIVDGQHRTTAALLCGIESVPCLVVLATQREQAEAFEAINGRVTRVSRHQIFKARIAAGDAGATRIQACAARAGVRIVFSHQVATKVKPHETAALNVITALIAAHGEDVVVRGLRAIRLSAGDCQGYLTAGIIKPVVQCLAENPAFATHPDLDSAMMGLDLLDEQDKAKLQALRRRGQTTADNLRIRVAEHLERDLAPKLRGAA